MLLPPPLCVFPPLLQNTPPLSFLCVFVIVGSEAVIKGEQTPSFKRLVPVPAGLNPRWPQGTEAPIGKAATEVLTSGCISASALQFREW